MRVSFVYLFIIAMKFDVSSNLSANIIFPYTFVNTSWKLYTNLGKKCTLFSICTFVL